MSRKYAVYISAIFLSLLFFGAAGKAQIPVALSPVARQQFLSPAGVPLANGCVFTYAAGTSTPLATYSDSSGMYPNANPIILDAAGSAPIWLINASYRLVVYSAGGSNCATGSQQWAADNVSAYQTTNIFTDTIFAGVTSFPSASNAGELIYRSDLGRFCFFYSIWDCITGIATSDILTSKTIDIGQNSFTGAPNTAGHYPRNNGTKYVDSTIQPSDLPNYIPESFTNSSTGTGLNLITQLAGGSSSQVITVNAGQTGGAIGICASNCGPFGTFPSASIAMSGQVPCVFDGATTLNDYVQISATVAGDCHDAGGSYPSTGQVLGRVLSSNGAGGTYSMLLFPAEIKSTFPIIVFSTPSPASDLDISNTTMVTATASGATYRFSFYADVTAAGTSCGASSTLVVSITFTDPNTSSPVSLAISVPNSGNTIATVNALGGGGFNGAPGSAIPSNNSGTSSFVFRAKAGSVIQYAANYTAGASCAPGASYQVYPILEQLTAN